MADEEPGLACTLEKVGEGHWRRTYMKDGVTADLHAEFHHLWLDLTDFQFVQGMTMNIAGTASWKNEDEYSETITATARGHIDNASLHFIEKREGDPWRMNTVNVFLQFTRAWDDPTPKKMKSAGEGLEEMFKLVETDESWTIGECQMGAIHHNTSPMLSPELNELITLNLQAPRDFLGVVRKAAAHPARVGRIRIGVSAELFEEGAQGAFANPWNHLDFMFEREGSGKAYLANFLIYSAKALPTPAESKQDDEDGFDRRPLAVRAADMPAHAPAAQYSHEIIKLLKYGVIALVAIAVILLLKR